MSVSPMIYSTHILPPVHRRKLIWVAYIPIHTYAMHITKTKVRAAIKSTAQVFVKETMSWYHYTRPQLHYCFCHIFCRLVLYQTKVAIYIYIYILLSSIASVSPARFWHVRAGNVIHCKLFLFSLFSSNRTFMPGGYFWGYYPGALFSVNSFQLISTSDTRRWNHQMDTFSALLALCAGNSPVCGEFPARRPVTLSFDVFFDLHPIKRLSKTLARLVIWEAIAPIMTSL